jgi:hypothetical protein
LGKTPQKKFVILRKYQSPTQRTGGFQKEKTPYRTNGLVVRKDGYRRDFFPNFLATVDNIRKPTVFYFSFFVVSRIWRIFGKKKRKIVQFALGRKFPEN